MKDNSTASGGGDRLKVLDLFSGIGGFSLGLERTGGFETVAFCEIDPWNQRVLATHWPDIAIFNDVTELTAEQVGHADFICGGFPCQDASVANIGGAGAAGARTGLFREIIRLAWQLECRGIIMENVPNLLNRGFGDVLGALAEIGFDAEWECISARDLGAPHERDRLWIVAYPQCPGRKGFEPLHGVLGRAKAALAKHGYAPLGGWPELVADQRGLRISDGVSITMERRRLFGLGNAVVPQIPELIGRAILASLAQQRKAA